MAETNDPEVGSSSAVPIVILGGGNGPTAVVKILKEYDVHITIICTPADNGGSTGKLRDEFGDVMPQGDARRAVTVLMNGERAVLDAQFFDSRFEGGKMPQNGNGAGLTDHSMGNIEILMAEKLWGPIEGMRYICRKYGVKGEVLVMSIDNPHLHARLSDGKTLIGETKIDLRDKTDSRTIKKVWLEPTSFICSPAAEALRRARMIILSPGDFYTSLVPHFLIDGVARAISANTRAQVVFIPPLMSKWGETNGFSLGTFLKELIDVYGVGRNKLEVLMNEQAIPADLARLYKEKEQSEPIRVEQGADFQKIRHMIGQFQPTPLLNEIGLKNGVIRHDSKLLAQWLMKFLLKGNEYAFMGNFAGQMDPADMTLWILDLDNTVAHTTRDMHDDARRWQELTLVGGVHEFLEQVKARGDTSVLVTVGEWVLQMKKLRQLDLHMDYCILPPEVSPVEPLLFNADPASVKEGTFRTLMDKAEEVRVVIVGDRLDRDIAVGKRLGLTTVRMRLPEGKYAALEPQTPEETPDYTVNDFFELMQLPVFAET